MGNGASSSSSSTPEPRSDLERYNGDIDELKDLRDAVFEASSDLLSEEAKTILLNFIDALLHAVNTDDGDAKDRILREIERYIASQEYRSQPPPIADLMRKFLFRLRRIAWLQDQEASFAAETKDTDEDRVTTDVYDELKNLEEKLLSKLKLHEPKMLQNVVQHIKEGVASKSWKEFSHAKHHLQLLANAYPMSMANFRVNRLLSRLEKVVDHQLYVLFGSRRPDAEIRGGLVPVI